MSLIRTDFTEAPPAPPNVMVIFGAGGDLTARKLVPSLFHLSAARLLPDSFAVLGLDRLEMDDDGFRTRIGEPIREHLGEAFDQLGLHHRRRRAASAVRRRPRPRAVPPARPATNPPSPGHFFAAS